MKLKSISFENYKSFAAKQTLKLKPITILIGKNSSGKSSIAKLFPLFENSLSKRIKEPLLLINNSVELGGEFDNLFFGNKTGGIPLTFSFSADELELSVSLFKHDTEFGLYVHQWVYKDSTKVFDLEFKGGNIYFETNSKKEYKCSFNGFYLTSFKELGSEEERVNAFNFPSIDVDYIGPFRVLPDRFFYLTGQLEFHNTGVKGENAYSILGISKSKKGDNLCENVGSWYKSHFDDWELVVNNTSRKPLIEILLSKNGTEVNIVDVGQGMNQALPLIVRSHIKKEHSIIILEQPELHLHPAAHGDLIELFAKSAKTNNQTFVIETHSENIILRLRKLIIENSSFPLNKEDVVIYWVENSETKGQELREITISDEGELSDWPEGVFNENLAEIIEIRKSIKRKRSGGDTAI